MSSTDESAGMADTDINSTDPDGTNVPGHDDSGSAATQGSGDDADRGNLDGSNPVAEPRDRSLDQAGAEAGGNGSFDEAAPEANGAESDAVDAGQDNGLNE